VRKDVIKGVSENAHNAAPQESAEMLALPNERWRDFVRLWLDGCKNHAEAARRAGFQGDNDVIKVTAYRLSHDDRIQKAIQAEARRRLNSQIPLALRVTEEIMQDVLHKDRAAVAKTVLDRAGLHEVREERHTHEFIGDSPELLKRVALLAERLGMPVEKLIGREAAKRLEPVEVEFAEIEKSEEA
jgi:hypothetical protein